MMKNRATSPPVSPSVFWAQMRCWSLCLLVLSLWGGIGITALCSPFLLGDTMPLGGSFSLPMYWLPLLLGVVIFWNCYKLWQNRLQANLHGIDHWTRNRYSFEVDDDQLDAFSSELENLCHTLAVVKPRWFVAVRNELLIKVYTPLASGGRAAILLTNGMLKANFSVEGRRTLLAHELGHVRLRSQLFDAICSIVNLASWSGLAVAAVFVHAYMGWHLLLLALLIPAVCCLASLIGDLLAALISRIHEASADRIADIVVGPGAVAACLLHLLQVQLSQAPEGERLLFPRRRQPGFSGLWCYLRGELLAEHPHELARIANSRKNLHL